MQTKLNLQSSFNISNEELHRFFDVFYQDSPQLVSITEFLTGKIIKVNNAFLSLMKRDITEIINRTTFDLDFWCNFNQRNEMISMLSKSGKIENFEINFQNPEKQKFTALLSSRVISVDTQFLVLHELVNISDLRKSEKLILQNENKFRTLLEQALLGIIITENDEITYLNEYVCKTLESEKIDLLGATVEQFFQTITLKKWKPLYQRYRIMIQDIHNFSVIEELIVLKSGLEKWIQIFPKLIVAENQNTVQIILRDITNQKRAEIAVEREKNRLDEELMRNQKIESIGVLAGGIAHDYNNILVAILGNLELLQMNVEFTGENKEIFEELRDGTHRAKELTNQLLTFSKGGSPVKRPELINNLLTESAKFVLRGSKSRCTFYIEEDLPPIHVDAGQINQVLNNLLINASQAMDKENGGLIKVSAILVELKNQDIIPLPDGQYVKISIQDHGIGIAKELQSKVFDPYFTTKTKGNGLGLATSFSIIRRHDGYITFISEPYIGTTFYIYLPISTNIGKAKTKSLTNVEIKKFGKILVLDDDKTIHLLLERILTKLGLKFESAYDGSELLVKYIAADTLGDPFDLVIMDLTIPGGMGGKETINQLRERCPEAKVIVSSGYSNDPILSNYLQYGFNDVLVKPYSLIQLKEKIAKFL